MRKRTLVGSGRWALGLLLATALAACGGGGGDKEDNAFSIRGNVTGLNGTVVLQNNGADDLTVSADGPFTFASEVARGEAYSVTVRTQPSGQICTVANGSGMTSTPVTDVLVSCANDPSFTIGGVVTGLNGTVVLRNGAENRTVSANGPFTFVGRVTNGGAYSVTVATQPSGQTCTVINGSGNVAGANVTNVTVRCVTDIVVFPIGGTVSGLAGGTLQLRLTHPGSSGTTISVTANGDYNFDPERVASGNTYTVTIAAVPAGQQCTLVNGSGTANGPVTNVDVTCTTVVVTHPIGGTVSGLTGGTLQLTLSRPGSSPASISVTSNGPYDFDPARVPDGDTYSVAIAAQPAGHTCSIDNESGVADGPVTDVDVDCSFTSPTTFSVGGTITGLTGAGLEIEQSDSNSVSPPPGSTQFTLPGEFDDGETYDLGIAEQPDGQTCVIQHSHGRISGDDVDDVEVTCIDNDTDPLVGTYTIPSWLPDRLVFLTLFADGVYIVASLEDDRDCNGNDSENGLEYGVYHYDQSSGSFTLRNAVLDTNGDCGAWDDGSQIDGTLAVSGSGQDKVMTLTIPGVDQFDLVPVPSTPGTIFGSFANRQQQNFWLFLSAGDDDVYFFNTQTQGDRGSTSLGHESGIEFACGDIDGTSFFGSLDPEFDDDECEVPAPDDRPVDTNGTSGLSHIDGAWNFTVVGDALTSSSFAGTRIVPN